MGWTTEEGEFSQMEGTTVTSRTTTDAASGNSVAHFAHTFTVDLRFDINQLDMMKEHQTCTSIDIFYQVDAMQAGVTLKRFNRGTGNKLSNRVAIE